MIEASTVRKAENEAEVRGEIRGLAKGRAEGKAEGLEKGIEQGIERRNQEIALRMLQQKLDETLIRQVTRMSEDQLLKLKSNR